MSQTLGAILRQQSVEADDEKTAKEKAALREAAHTKAADKVLVDDFLSSLKVRLSESILTTRRAPAVTLGQSGDRSRVTYALGLQHFFIKDTCQDVGHPYHGTWTAFQQWAQAQGLVVRWRSCHNEAYNDAGYPEESWWELETTFA